MSGVDYTYMEQVNAHIADRLRDEAKEKFEDALEAHAKKIDRIGTVITVLAILGALCLETPH